MGKIYAIVNQKNEYYNDWNDSFIKKINQDILYFDLKCAESILKNLNDRDDMYCDGCKIVELTIYPKQQIADLEAKLAESDAEIERLKEINAVQKNKIINIDKMYKQSQEEQKQLKQKLAESESESNARYSAWQEEICECDRLREQLAEKEKEHELLIDQFEEETENLRKQIKQESDARKRFIEANKQLKQSQNQTAIAELEKAKEEIKSMPLDNTGHDNYDFEKSTINYCLTKIDQQIKSLKGEKVVC